MAIFSTDRERRMMGDRLVALRDAFVQIDPALVTVYELFCREHGAFSRLQDLRRQEIGEDAAARRARQEESDLGALLYGWLYLRVPLLLRPTWDTVVDPELEAEVMERLFPLGPPSLVARSIQLVLDGLTHLQDALPREPTLTVEPTLLQVVSERRDLLAARTACVTVEQKETRDATEEHAEARKRWDASYRMLREATLGYLRLQNRDEELARLFTVLPTAAAAGPHGAPATTTSDAPAKTSPQSPTDTSGTPA